jgi:hypothetical protein
MYGNAVPYHAAFLSSQLIITFVRQDVTKQTATSGLRCALISRLWG